LATCESSKRYGVAGGEENENWFLHHGRGYVVNISRWLNLEGVGYSVKLSTSFLFVSALHSSDSVSAHYGMVCAMEQQSRCSPIKWNILDSSVNAIVTQAHRSYHTFNREILFWMVVLSGACTEGGLTL
jgi:hypothetical protein